MNRLSVIKKPNCFEYTPVVSLEWIGLQALCMCTLHIGLQRHDSQLSHCLRQPAKDAVRYSSNGERENKTGRCPITAIFV